MLYITIPLQEGSSKQYYATQSDTKEGIPGQHCQNETESSINMEEQLLSRINIAQIICHCQSGSHFDFILYSSPSAWICECMSINENNFA